MEEDKLTLMNIGEGIVPELYEDGLQKILANIADEETSQKKARKLVIEFTFEPTEKPEELEISIGSRTTLSPKRGIRTKAYMSYTAGERGLTATNPQLGLQFQTAAGE